MTVTTVNVKPKSSADSDSDADSDAEDAQALGKDGEYNFSRVSKHRIKEFYLGNRMYKTHGLCCYGAAYSLDGTLIAACGQDKTVTIHESIGKLKEIRRLIGHHSPVLRVVWGETNERLLSAANGELIIWNASNGEVAHFFGQCHDNLVSAIDWARWEHIKAVDQIFASASYDKTIKIWQFSRFGGKEKVAVRHVITCNEKILSMAMHPTLEQLVAGCADGNIHLYGVHTGASMEPIRTFSSHSDAVLCLKWQQSVPGDKEYNIPPLHADIFASASHDKTVKLWYRDQQRCYRTFSGHTNVVLSVAFGPEANPNTKRYRVFTAGHDATIGIWEGRSGKLLNMMKDTNHNSWITSVGVHPTDGVHMLTTSIQERYSLVRWDPYPPLPTTREVIIDAAKKPIVLLKPLYKPTAEAAAVVYNKVLRKVLPIDRVAALYQALRHSVVGRFIRNFEDLIDLVQWHISLKVFETRLWWDPYHHWWRKCYFEGLEILETGEIKPKLRKQWERRRRRYRIKLIMALFPYRAIRFSREAKPMAIWAIEAVSRGKHRKALQWAKDKANPIYLKMVEKTMPARLAASRCFNSQVMPRVQSLKRHGAALMLVHACRRVFQRSSKVSDLEPSGPTPEEFETELEFIDKVLFIFLHFDKPSEDEYLDRQELNALLTLIETIDPEAPPPLEEDDFLELIKDFNPPEERAAKGLSLEGLRTLFEYAKEEVEEKVFESIRSNLRSAEEEKVPGLEDRGGDDEVSITALDGNDIEDITAPPAAAKRLMASDTEIDALQRRMAQIQSGLQEAMQRHDVATVRALTLERNSLRNEIAEKTGKAAASKPQAFVPVPAASATSTQRSGGWLLQAPPEM